MPDIFHKFNIKAAPDKVFEAFSTPTGLNSWWTQQASGEPTLNEVYNFYFSDENNWHAEVIHMVPNETLTWKMTDAMEDWLNTEVGFKLSPVNEGTDVFFFHKGWKEASDHFAITNYCWGQLLGGLKKYVEDGIIIPFEFRN